ncbi:MAG: hypothetical protein JO316_09400 [Abitibacteriaceae bacterium]|nr:hypothetical protein [Abditibacteriaceae bacterium]
MITIFEFQAHKIERIAAALAHFVATTPPERLDWCPATDANSHTRSILAMVVECVQINRYTAALLRGETPEAPPAEGAIPADLSTAEGAQQQLLASGHELATAVAALDETALTHLYPHWRGPIVGAVLIESPYRNMAYHAGQVNLIQLLAGDTEFHLPPTWL